MLEQPVNSDTQSTDGGKISFLNICCIKLIFGHDVIDAVG